VYAALLRPLPYHRPAQLALIWSNFEKTAAARAPASGVILNEIRHRNRLLQDVAGIWVTVGTFTGDDNPEQVKVVNVTTNFLHMLGVKPALGRVFTPDEEYGGHPAIVLSNGLWKRRFGTDPAIVGKGVPFQGVSATVVGVLPEDTPHKLKLWAGYDFRVGRLGTLSASLLQTYESGAPYSVASTIDATGRTAGTAYTGLPVNPGYTLSQIGTSHTYFFSGRGSLRADALNRTDATLVYELPIARGSIRLQGTMTNLFNKSAVTNPDTTVFTRRTSSARGLLPFNPFTATPIECPKQNTFASAAAAATACTAMGANYQKADTFGQAIGVSSYQTARTYIFAAGVRF